MSDRLLGRKIARIVGNPAKLEAIRLWEYRHELETGSCKPCNKMLGALPGDLVMWHTKDTTTRCYLICTYSRPGGGGMFLVSKDYVGKQRKLSTYSSWGHIKKEVGNRQQPLVNHDHTFRLLQKLIPNVPTPLDLGDLQEWYMLADWIEEYSSQYTELATLIRIEKSVVSKNGGWRHRLYHTITSPLYDTYIFLRRVATKERKGKLNGKVS